MHNRQVLRLSLNYQERWTLSAIPALIQPLQIRKQTQEVEAMSPRSHRVEALGSALVQS